jgi:uncharacterized protein
MIFEWDDIKNKVNIKKHDICFEDAQPAFFDPMRVIAEDIKHSKESEKRYFCFGKVGNIVLTVRFTIRQDTIRIFGAGAWREGRKIYEQKNS